jgi:galactokinase
LIDCRTLEAVAVPVDTSRAVFVVCDTRVKHELAASAYNERRAECERAVELLRGALPGVRALRDVSVADFERHEQLLPEPVRRRARHVVGENDRTLEAAAALRAGALERFGRLMYESHESLSRDFEVSSPELDTLVRVAAAMPAAVFGARMTGGGFGGCTVNLVRRDAVGEFRDTVAREYNRATGRDAPVYVCEAADGAGELEANDEL